MATPKSQRTDGQLTVIEQSKELAEYTIKICSNEKVFPKRYRWCLTSKLVDSAIEVCSKTKMANSVFVKDRADYTLRKGYQTEAIASASSLLSLIEVSASVFGIDMDRVRYWTKLVVNVKNSLQGWRESDAKRYDNK